MKKLIICFVLIIGTIAFFAYREHNVILENNEKAKAMDGQPIKYEDLEPEVEAEMLSNILKKFNKYYIRMSEATSARVEELRNELGDSVTIAPVDDELYTGILILNNNSVEGEDYYLDENGNVIYYTIETNHLADDKVLIGQQTEPIFGIEKVKEIAEKDKDVIYVATYDWKHEIPLEEVTTRSRFLSYATNVDNNGIVKCIVEFSNPD